MIFQQVIHTVHKQITIGFSFSLYLEDFFQVADRYRAMISPDRNRQTTRKWEEKRYGFQKKITNSYN